MGNFNKELLTTLNIIDKDMGIHLSLPRKIWIIIECYIEYYFKKIIK